MQQPAVACSVFRLRNRDLPCGKFKMAACEEGYCWIVLAASFFSLFFNSSVVYSAGIFHVALLEEYDYDVTVLAWLGSLFTCMWALGGPLASLVINIFDCRTCVVTSGVLGLVGFAACYIVTDIRLMFLTYALLPGLGVCFSLAGALVVLGFYFPKNCHLAMGICSSGAGLGMFAYPALIQYLIRTCGLHGAFLLTGASVFQSCICGVLMRPLKSEKQRKKKNLKNRNLSVCSSFCKSVSDYADVFKNIPFLFFALGFFLFSMAFAILYLYLPDYYYTHDATFEESSLAISASGVGSLLSRFLTGFAANDDHIGSAILFPTIPGIMGMFTLGLPLFVRSSVGRIAYGFFLGLYTGGAWVLLNTVAVDILGLAHFATGVGVVMFSSGLGWLIGPPIGGVILKQSGHFTGVFLFGAVLLFSTTLCGIITAITSKTTNNIVDGDNQADAGFNVSSDNLKERHHRSEIEILVPPPESDQCAVKSL